MKSRVTGRIWFDDAAGPFTGAVLRVKLEEVSRADAPAREISRVVFPNYSHSPDEPPADFSMEFERIDPSHRYEVRVHLDINGNDQYSAGDQITVQSYPVLTKGYPNAIEVRLQQIS